MPHSDPFEYRTLWSSFLGPSPSHMYLTIVPLRGGETGIAEPFGSEADKGVVVQINGDTKNKQRIARNISTPDEQTPQGTKGKDVLSTNLRLCKGSLELAILGQG